MGKWVQKEEVVEGPRSVSTRVGGGVPAAGNAGAFQNVEKQEVAESPPPLGRGPPAPPHLPRSESPLLPGCARCLSRSPELQDGRSRGFLPSRETEAGYLISGTPQMVAQESSRGLTRKSSGERTLESMKFSAV